MLIQNLLVISIMFLENENNEGSGTGSKFLAHIKT